MKQITLRKVRQFRKNMVEGELYSVTTSAATNTEYALLFIGRSTQGDDPDAEILNFKKVSTGQELYIPISEPGLVVEWEYSRSTQSGPLPDDPMAAVDLARLYVKYGLAPVGKTPREVARAVQQGWRPFPVDGR